jgi:hypothetical protein
MKLLVIALLIPLSVVPALMPHGAAAARLGVPVSAYPLGANISYRPVLTNAEMDCLWNFFCEGDVPLFHLASQDQLHRLGGWAQFAGVQQHGRMTMAFQLFVSQYSTVPDADGAAWSEDAFLDLTRTIHAQRYRSEPRTGRLLPSPAGGGALVAVQHSGSQDLVIMARWAGSLEIEGIASYNHGSQTAKQTAIASLALQIHLASERGVSPRA